MQIETVKLEEINKKIDKLKSEKKISKKIIANEMGILPSQLTFYLKYGDIPEDRYQKLITSINKKRNEKRKARK
jgi:hypothetical protein